MTAYLSLDPINIDERECEIEDPDREQCGGDKVTPHVNRVLVRSIEDIGTEP
jgi:hypothetical protein